LVPKPGLYQWESPNALIDVAIPTSLLLGAGKGCLPLFVSLCPLPPLLSSKCNTLITPEDTPRGCFGRAGSRMRTPTPTALHPALKLEILKPSALRTSRFFTYNPDSRSVLDMNSTKTAHTSSRRRSPLRSIREKCIDCCAGNRAEVGPCSDADLRAVAVSNGAESEPGGNRRSRRMRQRPMHPTTSLPGQKH
jgi:hypothetical protein